MSLLLLDATPPHLRFLVLLLSFDNSALAFAQTTAASDPPQSCLPELREQSDDGLVGGDSGHSYLDPFPFSQSDTVIVGQVAAGQEYFSDDNDKFIRSSTPPCRGRTQFHLRNVTCNQAIVSSLNVKALQFASRSGKVSFVPTEIFLCLSLASAICYFKNMTRAQKTFISLLGINWTASLSRILMSTLILTGTTPN